VPDESGYRRLDDGKQEQWRLHCFTDREAAAAFLDRFGGIMFDPKRDRENGRARGVWRRKGAWQRILNLGPLSVPEIPAELRQERSGLTGRHDLARCKPPASMGDEKKPDLRRLHPVRIWPSLLGSHPSAEWNCNSQTV